MAAIPLQDRSMTNTSSDNENERQNEQVNDNEREYINRHVESELDFDGDDEGGVMDRECQVFQSIPDVYADSLRGRGFKRTSYGENTTLCSLYSLWIAQQRQVRSYRTFQRYYN